MKKITNYKIQITNKAPVYKKGRCRMTNYKLQTMRLSKKRRLLNFNVQKNKGSYGLHQGTFKLQTMTALIKSFRGCFMGSRGGGFFKKSPPWPPEARNENRQINQAVFFKACV
jgi:hypothetical protein